MSSYRFIFFLGLLVFGSSSLPVNAQEYTKYQSSDGHEFAVSVIPDKSTIMLGETTFLAFEVKNLSDAPLYFSDGGDYRNNIGRPERYSVTVMRDDGTPVPQPKVTMSTGGLLGSRTVPLGGSYVRRLFLPHWATFESPGTYDITVSRILSISTRNDDTVFRTKDANRPVATTAHTKITIIETDPTKLGETISDLGDKVLADSDNPNIRDNLLLLDFIKDGRTIPYWVKAVERYSSSSNWKLIDNFRQTPSILARYDTPEAIATIEAAMKSKNKDVRLDVAESLSISKNPRAIPLLLSMSKDPYWFVRLRVVQTLDQLDNDESARMLTAFLLDKERSVRESAEESLRRKNRVPEIIPRLPITEQACSIRQISAVKTMQQHDNQFIDGSSMGGLYSTENCAIALNGFLEELSMRREIQDLQGEAWVLRQIGDIYSQVKDSQKAYDYYRLALPLFHKLNTNLERQLLAKLEGISMTLKRPIDALEYLNRELSLTRANENEDVRADEGRILDRIATVYSVLKDDTKRLEYLKKRLDFESENKHSYGMSMALLALGKAYEASSKKVEALDAYTKALNLLETSLSDYAKAYWVKEVILELQDAIARLQK